MVSLKKNSPSKRDGRSTWRAAALAGCTDTGLFYRCSRWGASVQARVPPGRHDTLGARRLHIPGVLRSHSSAAATGHLLPAGPLSRCGQGLPPRESAVQTGVLDFLVDAEKYRVPTASQMSALLHFFVSSFLIIRNRNLPIEYTSGVYLRELILVRYLQLPALGSATVSGRSVIFKNCLGTTIF